MSELRTPFPLGALRPRIALLASLAALLMCAIAPGTALAHARLVSSDPPSGSALGRPPASFTLTFSEEIHLEYSAAFLRDAGGGEAPLGALELSADRRTLTVPTVNPAALPPGSYTLIWRVLSAVDGHATTGVLAFSAGTGEEPAVTGATGPRPPWWRVGFRWLWLAGIAGAAGALLFMTTVDRSPLPAHGRKIATAAALLGVTAAALSGYDLGPGAAGTSFRAPPGIGTYLEIVANASTGRWWLVSAIATAALLAVVVAGRGSVSALAWAGAGAAGVALLGFSASGHAASTSPALLGITTHWLHVAAVTFWLGSLPYLWLTLRAGHRRAATVASRFSTIGLATVGVIVVTGLLRALAHVDGPRNLTNDDYGILLIAKHLLFLPILVAAGVNRLVLVPRLRAAGRGDDEPARTALSRSASGFVAVELGFALAMLVAAAALTEVLPADGPLPVDVAAKTVTIDQRAPAGDLEVWLLARLTGEASDRYSISVATPHGSAPGGLQRVIVSASVALGDATVGDRFDATELRGSPGTYVFPAVRLSPRGVWDVEIIVRRAGLEDVAAHFAVDTSAAGRSAPRLVHDVWILPRVTVPAWSLGFLALFVLIGGIVALKRLRELQPFAAAILLTMTLLIVAGFAVQAYRWTVPVTAATNLVNPIPPDDASIARGRDLYTRQCLACHGPLAAGLDTADDPEHGHGTSADLTDPRSAGQRDGDLFHAISNGIPGSEMPAYDEALTEDERWDLVNYLRVLQDR